MLLFDCLSTLNYLSSGRPNVRRGSFCLDRGIFLKQQSSLSDIRSSSSRPDFRSAESINTYHADMDISVFMPAFFVPGTLNPVEKLSAN